MEYIVTLMGILNLVMMNPNIEQATKDQIFSQGLVLIEQGSKVQQVEVVPAVVAPVTYSAPVDVFNTGTTTENVVSYTTTTTMETEQFVFVKKSPEIGLGVLPNGNVGTKFIEVKWVEPNGKEYVSWVSRTDDYQPFGFVSGVSYTLTGYKDTKMVDKKAVGVGETGTLIGVME